MEKYRRSKKAQVLRVLSRCLMTNKHLRKQPIKKEGLEEKEKEEDKWYHKVAKPKFLLEKNEIWRKSNPIPFILRTECELISTHLVSKVHGHLVYE